MRWNRTAGTNSATHAVVMIRTSAHIRRCRRVRGAGRVRAAVGLGLHRRQARAALCRADDLPHRADGRGGAGARADHPADPAGCGPRAPAMLHSAVTGLFVHGCYLGGVFVAIDHKLPAGFAALVVSLQPILTSTLANRLLGERVTPRQWARPRARHRRGLSRRPRPHRRRGAADRLGRGHRRPDRHDHRHALSEALRRRHRMAHRVLHPVCRRGRAVRACARSPPKRSRCNGRRSFCSPSPGWCSGCRSARSGCCIS